MSEHTTHLSAAEADTLAAVRPMLASLGAESAQRVLEALQDEQRQVAETERPLYARGVAGPLGKLVCDLKTKVDEHTDNLFRSHCAMVDSDSSAVLRDCVYALVHKRTYSQMVAEN